MEKKDSSKSNSPDLNLVKTLTTLNEIGASINQLGVGKDLDTTLKLIAGGAVKAVAAGSDVITKDTGASAVIWVYDAAKQAFDSAFRVSAGEPEGTSIDDYPRPDGLGRQAIQLRRRLLSHQAGTTQIHPAKRDAGARSLVCYPLEVGGEVVGVLYVYRCDERRFSKVELLILDNFVQLAAIAIHYGRRVGGLSRALKRKVREMEKLKRASHLISSRPSLNETLQEILTIGLDMTAAQYGSFELYDRKRDLLVSKALAGSKESPAREPQLPVNENSVVGWAAVNCKSVKIDNLREPPWCNIYYPLPFEREMLSELAVPMFGAGGGLEGVINVESPFLDAFSTGDQQLLEALATQAVIAIQEIRLLDAMQEIVEVLLSAKGDDLFKLIINRACDLINVPDGSIWILSAPETLVLRQSTDGTRVGEQLSLSNSLTGQAMKLHQPIAIDDVRLQPNFMRPELAAERGWVSSIVVPLLAAQDDARPVGSFALYATDLRDFSDWDKKLLTCLANHAAVAIRDAEQLQLLKQAQERQSTAEAMAAVGDVAANLLHQLNNKFGAISVRVQGIEDKCEVALETWPYLANNLQAIANSTRQAMAIVRNSMAPLQPVRSQPVKIELCLKRAVDRAALPGPIQVTQTGIETLPRVVAGEKQLEMVFYNLIDNARKAMDGHGDLTFIGRYYDNFAGVTVADTGPGIPPEMRPRIFEFASAAEKQSSGRLSFGLWWVKTFVDRFGGRIELESTPGQGSRFTVWLPAEKGN